MACFKPFKIVFKACKNKWIFNNNDSKVKKETLAHWIDMAFNRTLSNSNIMASFRAIGIWPLNLKTMEQ